MNNIDSYFLSINDDVFCPPILDKIKQYLNCEQVFIYKLDKQGELENVIYSPDTNRVNISSKDKDLSQIDQSIIPKIIKSVEEKESDSEDTAPIKKAELNIPIELKTPEVIAVNKNITLWGILFIYDYNYLRQWSEEEIKFVQDVVYELTLGIERNIIYRLFKNLEQKIQYYKFFDEETGLINYSSFIDCLDYEWRNLGREKNFLSLILIDFYQQNNSNELISNTIANIIQEEIKRPADIVADYGSNKIIIMLPLTDNAGALWVNNQVMTKIQIHSQENHNYQFRSSIVSCIPTLSKSYGFLLKKLEMPFTNNLNFENNTYNQNLE